MAIEIIPDKICPHCGGNRYYVSKSKNRECVLKAIERSRKKYYENREECLNRVKLYERNHKEKRSEYNKIYKLNNPEIIKKHSRDGRRKAIEELRDSYVKDNIIIALRRENIYNISHKDISKEQVELQRHTIKVHREIIKQSNMTQNPITLEKRRQRAKEYYHKNKNLKKASKLSIKDYEDLAVLGIDSNSTNDELSSLQIEYDKLGEFMLSKEFKSFQHKSKVYNQRSILKKQINSLRKDKGMSLIESKPISRKYAKFNISEIDTSLKTEVIVPPEKKELDIVEELRQLEKRRNEILNEVSEFNNYVESLKIKL